MLLLSPQSVVPLSTVSTIPSPPDCPKPAPLLQGGRSRTSPHVLDTLGAHTSSLSGKIESIIIGVSCLYDKGQTVPHLSTLLWIL